MDIFVHNIITKHFPGPKFHWGNEKNMRLSIRSHTFIKETGYFCEPNKNAVLSIDAKQMSFSVDQIANKVQILYKYEFRRKHHLNFDPMWCELASNVVQIAIRCGTNCHLMWYKLRSDVVQITVLCRILNWSLMIDGTAFLLGSQK